MKVVILAGGFGTRISEESQIRPKPMVEIGDMPILWHIMKHYLKHGFDDFIICCGYKAYSIKEYFVNYYFHTCDITVDFSGESNKLTVHSNVSEPWKVTLVDTGLKTMTGGRVKRVKDYVGNEPFMVTYGDGVSDIDLTKALEFHKSHGKLATISTYNYGQRFGVVEVDKDNYVEQFREKNNVDGNIINIGFMIFEPQVFDYIEGDKTILEKEPLMNLAAERQLMSYRHDGFWQCMDTLRDKKALEELWVSGNAPWKTW